MEKKEILIDIENIFKTILDNDDLELSPESTPNDIEQWDSLNHMQLLNAVEKKFEIKFKLKEMMNFKNVGDICDAVMEKKSG